ncbi:hypothetical protein CDD81_2902 [Ophiocordyceps australis]|uniref:Deoxyribonuclease NucA/NucB domain-containing protein n=1 Tax=Ophiocordyceps australis TaxID=1399860 RepID=A0A2C5YHN3_9HYPO|nr:hypothetical protein CDD81_2902 [Ophiocordyceps australis]
MFISLAAATFFLVGSAAAKGVVYDCEKTPQICLNTCWAIKCQKNSETLHGGGQKDKSASSKYGDANRRKWGYGSKPCDRQWKWTTPDNKAATSPDEYPYASSKEGGESNFQRVVALRCVPTTEQSSQGGKLKGLGTSKNSETWNTKWINISKLSQDWCGPKPSCKNDGHQFVSGGSNGPFTLASNPKKVRDIGSYSADGNSAWVESREVSEDVVPEKNEDDDGDDAEDPEDVEEHKDVKDVDAAANGVHINISHEKNETNVEVHVVNGGGVEVVFES